MREIEDRQEGEVITTVSYIDIPEEIDDGWIDRCAHGQTDRWMHGWMGQIDEGLTDGEIDGWG